MLDIHPPEHTPHTWRDFFIHMFTIVLGLVIAIGLEQSVEAIHHRHQRHELELQLRDEAQRNVDLAQVNIARLQSWVRYYNANIAALNNAPLSDGRIKTSTLIPPGHIFDVEIFDPSQTVWAVAKANGTVGLLPDDEAQVYARLDHESTELGPGSAAIEEGRVKSVALATARRGQAPGQLESLSLEQRDALVQLFATASAQAAFLTIDERNLAGACRGVLHGARTVNEMLQYMVKESRNVPKPDQLAP